MTGKDSAVSRSVRLNQVDHTAQLLSGWSKSKRVRYIGVPPVMANDPIVSLISEAMTGLLERKRLHVDLSPVAAVQRTLVTEHL